MTVKTFRAKSTKRLRGINTFNAPTVPHFTDSGAQRRKSALDHKRAFRSATVMSALPRKRTYTWSAPPARPGDAAISCGLLACATRRSLWPLAFFALARGLAFSFEARASAIPPRTTHRLAVAWCPVYLLRSRLPSLSPGMPSHSPCSVYCQSHHCGNVAFGQLGVPDVYCASQSRYCDSSESRLSPSCSFSTWPE